MLGCLLSPGRASPPWSLNLLPAQGTVLVAEHHCPALSRLFPSLEHLTFCSAGGEDESGWAPEWAASLPTHGDLPPALGHASLPPPAPGHSRVTSPLPGWSACSHSARTFRNTAGMAGDQRGLALRGLPGCWTPGRWRAQKSFSCLQLLRESPAVGSRSE